MRSKLQMLQIKIFIAENCRKMQKIAQKSFCNKFTSLIVSLLEPFFRQFRAKLRTLVVKSNNKICH